jgi:SOS response regulatory protein OraA/RecX
VDEIYHQALKLLRRRDYTIAQLREKLESKFGEVPKETIDNLQKKRFLDDARYAGNFVIKRRDFHPSLVREELLTSGVSPDIVEQALSVHDWPSLQHVARAKLIDWKLQAPLQRKEANRLYRILARLGYPEDEIREELNSFMYSNEV